MPLTRYQIRSEHTLADPELYRAAEKDDPEAILEGVAMAGLVGVLRQLGDLAEFAAEIFHDLHEEVMETAARGHGLMVRVQQLEAECPSIEKAFLSQTDHSTFFHNKGVDWHPNQRMDQNLITGSHLPRFVMDSYDECRGPPRLFLLDKFDIAGAGACLKRYTDPSFFKGETEAQRDHKIRKVKKKGSRWRNGGTPEVVPTSHAKLHQLLEEERVQNGNNDPARLVKLKRRQLNGSAFVSNTGKSYMEKFLETPSHDEKSISQVSVSAVPVESTVNSTCDSIHEIVEIGMVSPTKEKLQRKRTAFSSPYTQETDLKLRMEDLSEVATDREILRVPEAESAGEADRNLFTAQEVDGKKDFAVVGDIKKEGSIDDYHSDDVSSEVDNYVDAFPTMESDMDTDSEYRLGNNLSFLSIEKHGTDCEANEEAYDLRQSSDSQSIRNSSTSVDGSSSTKKGIYSSSYSDTMSNLAENILSDGDCTAKMFPSIGCVAETVSPSPDQSSASEKISGTKTLELVAFNSTSIEEVAQISRHRSDQGEASCSSCLTDFDPTPVSLNPGASSVVDSSDYTKHCTGSLNADGNGRTLCDDSQVTSHVDAPSETSKVSLPQVSAEFHPVDEVVDPDNSNISSDVLLHMTISDVSPGKKIEGSIVRKMCQAEQADDSSTEKLVNGTHSATSPRGEQLPDLPFPGLETCSKLKPELPNSLADSSMVDEVDMASSAGVDAVTTVVDNKTDSTPAAGLNSQEIAAINNQVDAISASGVHSENLDTAADSRQSVSFSEQHLSKVSHDVSPLELDSLEVNGRHSGGQVTDEWASSSLNDGENGSSTTDLDRLGNSDFPRDPTLEDLVQIADMASETAQVDAAATFATAMAPTAIVDGVEDDVNDVTCPSSDQICSPSWNSGDSEDTLSTSGRSNKDLEFNETIHPIPLGGSEMQKEVNQLSAAPALSFLCDATPGDNSNSKGIGDAANLSLAEKKEGLSSKQVDQNLETSPTKSRSDLVENIEYSVSLSYDHSPEPNIPLEQNQKLLVNQSAVDCLHGNKMNSVPLNDQLLDMHPSSPMDQDKSSGVPSKVCSEDLLNLYSAPQPLQQPDDPNLESCVKSTGPLVSIFPSFVQLPKENPVNLEEMPPLPPLPPMQWRVGKLPEVPKPSGEETSSHGLDSIPLLLPCKMADEHAHIGIPLLEVGSESQNPYFPSSTTQQEEKPDHVSGCSAEDMAQPSEVTLQLPTANDDDIQHDLLTSNESKPPSPSIALPPMSNELHQNGLPVSEGEMVQNLKSLSVTQSIEGAVPKHLPILLQEKPIENLNQIEAETSLEDKNHQQAFESSEGDMLNPPRTFLSLPTTEAGQSQDHQHPSQTTDVEPLPPPSEDEKLNGKPLMKIPRPRDPLIEAVAAHDKSKLKKVTERVRPQIVAKVDNRDSLLEQIRAKSFNLKPAAVARPSIQGPNTNLRVAAILEKANAIRQALAGSDEDDDADGWSSDS